MTATILKINNYKNIMIFLFFDILSTELSLLADIYFNSDPYSSLQVFNTWVFNLYESQ